MTDPKLYKFQRGGTMIEALVSVAVFSVGALGISKMQVEMSRNNIDSNLQNKALILAQEKIEELRNFSNKTGYSSTINSSSDTRGSKDVNYARNWAVVTNTNPNYKTVNVTVSWTNSANQNKSVNLSSVISEHDAVKAVSIYQEKPTDVLASLSQEAVYQASLPEGAVDNGDGTSNYTPEGTNTTLTYDNETGNVTKINDMTVHHVTGQITQGSGSDKPQGNPDMSLVTISGTGGANDAAHCQVSVANDIVSYDCIVNGNWSGTFAVSGISNVKVCTNTSQPYSNIAASLTGQDYKLIKASRSCSGNTPTLHQDLS